MHGDEFVWEKCVGDELLGDKSPRIPFEYWTFYDFTESGAMMSEICYPVGKYSISIHIKELGL